MYNLELNKIIASILLASLVIMIIGNIADILYKPNVAITHRGYQIEVQEDQKDAASDVVSAPAVDIKALMANASAEAGAQTFKKCMSCHSAEKNGPNRIGPHLWDVTARGRAALKDYSYSSALLKKTGNWDLESLYAFLHKPSAYAPGTKMSFIGLAKPEDIANVIAYLETLKD